MSEHEYIIVGDTEKYGECLVYVCGTKENAENVLEKILTNPTENDLRVMQGHTNLRVKEVKEDSCWWRHGCD